MLCDWLSKDRWQEYWLLIGCKRTDLPNSVVVKQTCHIVGINTGDTASILSIRYLPPMTGSVLVYSTQPDYSITCTCSDICKGVQVCDWLSEIRGLLVLSDCLSHKTYHRASCCDRTRSWHHIGPGSLVGRAPENKGSTSGTEWKAGHRCSRSYSQTPQYRRSWDRRKSGGTPKTAVLGVIYNIQNPHLGLGNGRRY